MNSETGNVGRRPVLLVLASTYPRWRDDPEPGFVHELCRRLVGRFHVIALVPDSPDADPDGLLDGVNVVRYRYAPRRLQSLVNNGGVVTNLRRSFWKWLLVPGFVLGQYIAAKRLIRRWSVDVVHAHWLLPQGLLAQQLKVRYLVTSHGGDLFGLRGALLTSFKRKVAASCSAMTVVSSAMKAEALRLNLNARKIEVLPMGVDLSDRFTVDPHAERDADSILFVGRLVPKKGLKHLVDALPDIVRQRPSVTLTIAGFGPEEPALKAQASNLGIEAYIRFLGAMSQGELPALYRRASVFVAPFVRDDTGNQEGLPVVMMEAIGCGCPVVVGDVAGVTDLLGDFAHDVCVNPNDKGALATAVLDVLAHPEDAGMRAAKIRAAVVDKVDWHRIATAYATLIEGCISDDPAFGPRRAEDAEHDAP
jgi:glycosyltransferase involved in cell wall biosynthesis